MPDNIEEKVGLQFCYWKINDKLHQPEKAGSYVMNVNDSHEFFVNERCIGGKTKNPQSTIAQARWAYIYQVFFSSIQHKPESEITENLWGNLSGGPEEISKYALGTSYKQGANLVFRPSEGSYYYGFKQRIELFSKTPGTGFFFFVIPFTDPKISYAYFKGSEEIKRYGENANLTIMFHGYNFDENFRYKAKVYLLESSEASGLTTTEQFEDKNLWDAPVEKNLDAHDSSTDSNIYIRHNFNINVDWKKDQDGNKEFTVAVEVFRAPYTGRNSEKWERFHHRNFLAEPTSDLVSYDTELLKLEDVDQKASTSSRFIVSDELMSDYLLRINEERTDQIQYIGDINYTKREYDPCGYSKITVQDKADSERSPLIIFDENQPINQIDSTDQKFPLIAGDERKDITIMLDNLTTKDQFCQGLLLDNGEKHTEQKNVFQVEKVYAAVRDKTGFPTSRDTTHQEQQRNAGIATTEENQYDSDVSRTNNSYNPSSVQQWKDGVDYAIVSNSEITLKIRYLYNKTEHENVAADFFWMFRYFFLSDKMIQTNFLPISTCRYPNQLVKLNVYPDIEWLLSLKLSSTVPNVYSHTNMPSGPSYQHHQERAIEAGQNRRRLNKDVSFELVVKATTGSFERSIGASYEDKIEVLLKALIKVKEVLDNITGVTSARSGMAESVANRLPNFLGNSPITFQLDYPVISVEGGWKYGFDAAKKAVEIQGKLAVGLTPLIKGTGKLDLIACAEFIPPAKPIIMAIRTATKAAGVDIWFNLVAFGQIDISYTFLFGAIGGVEPLNVATTVGIGAELGVKASAEVPKLSFGSQTTENLDIGFEASARGETSLIVSGKQGSTTEGVYIEPSIGFGGMVVFVTAKASIWKMGVGFEDKPYELIKPEPDLLKDKFYIIKAKND